MDRSSTGSAGSAPAEWPPDVEPRWLDARELEEWMAMARVLTMLPARLERDLQYHANLNWMEYHALAMLSEHDGHTMRLTRLAAVTNASLSRLSHLVTRLEARGYLRREPDPDNGRFTNAVLTPAGYEKLVAAAPWHAESVRSLVFDAVDPADMAILRSAFDRISRALDQAAGTRGRSDPAANGQ
ncbi:hypothetical protein BL253_35860 [Pseudofrankia asymbiotica]|uniref:HTH marR-type domain-containing protein n=2 Tax=Pseudofrankia asymbiotica TaxID=1834516 RepID=A0A1V2HZX1_9ACTN|nr:hypothetical protein BL253_35860 [Pseudofrankia asymbiotica]